MIGRRLALGDLQTGAGHREFGASEFGLAVQTSLHPLGDDVLVLCGRSLLLAVHCQGRIQKIELDVIQRCFQNDVVAALGILRDRGFSVALGGLEVVALRRVNHQSLDVHVEQ